MKYFLDCEFDGFGGELLSMALVREDNEARYFVLPQPETYRDPWVAENVAPILWDIPSPIPGMAYRVTKEDLLNHLAAFLHQDTEIEIIADWPDDIRYFCESLITGPGMMINVPSMTFHMLRIDAYPTTLEGAVRHNAYWDALALMVKYYQMYEPAQDL